MNRDIIQILKDKLADAEKEVKHVRVVCAELQADLDKYKPLAMSNDGPRGTFYPDWDLVNRHTKQVVANVMHDDFKPAIKAAFNLLAKHDDISEFFLLLTDSARDLLHRGEIG